MSAPRYEFDLTGRQPQEPLPPDWFAPLTEEEAARIALGALDAGPSEAQRSIVAVAVTALISIVALMLVAIWFFLGIGHAPPAGNDLLAPPATANGVKP